MENSSIGYQSGMALTTGTRNTLIGALAGDTITTGTNNTIIGRAADVTAGASAQIVIGSGAIGLGDNQATIGQTSQTKANIYGAINSIYATGTAAGGGIDAATPSISVAEYNSEIVTTVFVDIGGGSIISSGSAGDVIGEDGVAAAYLTRITTAVNGIVYAGEIICLEVPTTGDADINVASNASGTIAEDAAGEGEHVLANCGTHTLGLRTAFTIPAGSIVDDYIYLTHGGSTAGTYDAGKFLLRFFGAKVTGL